MLFLIFGVQLLGGFVRSGGGGGVSSPGGSAGGVVWEADP